VSAFTESTVEEAALAWLESTGWRVAHGPDIAPDVPAAERRFNQPALNLSIRRR
jgi:type I restriction enzyme R subunit